MFEAIVAAGRAVKDVPDSDDAPNLNGLVACVLLTAGVELAGCSNLLTGAVSAAEDEAELPNLNAAPVDAGRGSTDVEAAEVSPAADVVLPNANEAGVVAAGAEVAVAGPPNLNAAGGVMSVDVDAGVIDVAGPALPNLNGAGAVPVPVDSALPS